MISKQPSVISILLDDKSADFQKKTKFIDCIIHSGKETYKAHRIVLARYSKWFYDYFQQEEQKKSLGVNQAIEIDLPVNPQNQFVTILNAVYSNELSITRDVSPALLKISVFYGFNKFIEPIKNFIENTTNEMTVLRYVRSFINYELYDESFLFTTLLAKAIRTIYEEPDSTLAITMKDLYDYITDGRVFAMILKNRKLCPITDEEFAAKLERRKKRAEELKPSNSGQTSNLPIKYNHERPLYLTDEQKVYEINKYCQVHPPKTEEEKQALASVIDWNKEGYWQFMLNYDMDWLPANIARPIYKKILENRTPTIEAFDKDLNSLKSDEVSHWFPFTWLSSIYNAKVNVTTPQHDIINFIATLGNSVENFNPYGIIDVKPVGIQTSIELAPENILKNDDSYFSCLADINEKTPNPPQLIIDFGSSTHIKVNSITINCDIHHHSPNNDLIKLPKGFDIQLINEEHKQKIEFKLPMEKPIVKHTFDEENSCPIINKIIITLDTDCPLFEVLRIKNVEVNGIFTQQ